MDRRRGAVALIGVLALVGAVVVLRGGTSADLEPLFDDPARADDRVVTEFAAQGVALPDPGDDGPDDPGAVRVRSEPGRLLVSWASAVPSGVDPVGAIGYRVRWGEGGNAALGEAVVSTPGIAIEGLDPVDHRVEVRTIDSVGRLSLPNFGFGVPRPRPDRDWLDGYSMVDDFDGASVPDPQRWRLGAAGRSCTRTGGDRGVLTIAVSCGSTVQTLLPSAPLALAAVDPDRPDAERGRVGIVTDAAGSGGEFSVSLVPGPVDAVVGTVAGAMAGAGAPSGALIDSGLPPGTVRVVFGTGSPTVTAAPGLERTGVAGPRLRTVTQAYRVPHRFEVIVRGDGLEVHRDGVPVAAADVVVPWEQAGVLFGFGAPPGGSTRVRVDTVAFTAGPAEASPITVFDVVAGRQVVAPGVRPPAADRIVPVPPGGGNVRLRVLLRASAGAPLDDVVAVLGTGPSAIRAPLRVAVPGTVATPLAPVTMITELPDPDAVDGIPVAVLESATAPGLEIVASSLTVGLPEGGNRPVADSAGPDPAPVGTAPGVSLRVIGPDGNELAPGAPLPPARVTVVIELDGPDGERRGGLIAGAAGVQLLVDGTVLAALPTARTLPAPGGRHEIGIDASLLDAGQHTLTAQVVPANPTVDERSAELVLRAG